MAKQTKEAKQPTASVPVHKVRHRRLEVAIWRNETAKGPMYNVTISRSYKENDTWHDTQSIGYDDLMNLSKLLYDAHSWISSAKAQDTLDGKQPPRS
jgi:hypothetical protein